MIENIDPSLVDWSRGQFALTAMYHWMFVPLTLGLSFIMAITETIYVKTGKPEWKNLTKFWMTLFGINFAIGVATGLILEFEFGTNWSNYSWFVGDIFGAPLAIEGIFAFFIESSFIAVMFFGWKRVSKGFHLLSTWMVAFGANLSALWILVANSWMQHPVGMVFNPDTARNEMVDFLAVVSNGTTRFFHTIFSAYVLAAIFVVGVSAWFLLKKRHILFAKRSILVASIFGVFSSVLLIYTGDTSGHEVAQNQPMKLAAMEGMYQGQSSAGLVAVGMLTPGKEYGDNKEPYVCKIEIPYMLSFLGYRDMNAYVPGINDLIEGNEEQGLMPAEEKIYRGQIAITALGNYKKARDEGDQAAAERHLRTFRAHEKYFGYGYLNDPASLIPNVPMTFYSFRIMVALGFYFVLILLVFFWLTMKQKVENKKWLLRLAVFSIPLPYIAGQAGWIVTEMGRQPWAIQDVMPTVAAVSRIDASSVITTFILFAITFTVLLIAEIKILTKQIKNGPKEEGGTN